MKFLKKSLSLLLVLCMLLGFLPVSLLVPEAKAAEPDDFYKIVQVDAGRKYWSLSVLEKLVDHMAINGYNQLGLYFSDNQGFRLALKDMTVEANGTTYDLSKALGNGIYQNKDGAKCESYAKDVHFRPSLETGKNYLDQYEMADLIQYARKRGIEIVPTFDMPGHMGAILDRLTDGNGNSVNFKVTYPEKGQSNTTLDVTSQTAVKFALALLEKYVAYFQEQGCKFFNICSDEFCYDLGVTAKTNTNEAMINGIVEFMDKAAQVIVNAGMTPRAYGDYMYQHSGNYSYSDAYGQFEVIYWDNPSARSLAQVQAHGMKIINGDEKMYYALGSEWYFDSDTKYGVEKFTPTVGITKNGGFQLPYANGAQFHIWCDKGYYESEVAKGGDAGATVLENTKGYIETLANTMAKDVPISCRYNLEVGDSVTLFNVDGDHTADDWAAKLDMTGNSVSVQTQLVQSTDTVIDLNSHATLSDGESLIIGSTKDGLYLKADVSAKTLSVVTDPKDATVFTCKASKFYVDGEEIRTDWQGILMFGGSDECTWSCTDDGLAITSWQKGYLSLSNGVGHSSNPTGITAYSVVPGHNSYTVVRIVAQSAGTTTFTYNAIPYTVIVAGEEVPCEHSKIEHYDRVEPTEFTTGTKEYWECQDCYRVFSDAGLQNQVSRASLVLDVLPHTTHKLKKVDMVAATVETEGIREHYECSVCHALFKDQDGTQSTTEAELVIPKLSQEDQKYAVTVEVGSQAAGTAVTTKTQDTGITAGSTYSVTNAEGTEIATYTVQVDTKEEQAGGDVTVGDLIGTDTIPVGGSAVCVLGDGTNYIKADCTLGNADAAAKWRITRETETQYSIQLEGESSYLTSTGFWGQVMLNAAKELWTYDGSKLTNPSGYYLTVYDNLPKTGNSGTPMGPYAAADSSAATYTVYTYTPTFTGKTAGTGEVIIGRQTYTVTVTAPHVHDSFTEEDYTCKGAYCTGCGQYVQGTDENPKAYVNPDNHVGGTEIRDAKEATETKDGYTGDTYCKGCNTMIEEGTTIPAGRTIVVYEHEKYEFYVESSSLLPLVHDTSDVHIEDITAVFMEAFAGVPKSKINAISELESGQEVLISDGGRYLVLDPNDNSLSVTTEEGNATRWTVRKNDAQFHLIAYGRQLIGENDGNLGKLTTQDMSLANWAKNNWVLDANGGMKRSYYPHDYIDLADGTLTTTTTATTTGIYVPNTRLPARTVVNLTAGTEGTTSFTLGGVRYNVIVKKEDVSGKSLTVEKFVTNQHMTDNETEKDYKDTPERRTKVIQAAEGTVNTEGGMLLADLIPTTGISNGITAVYWKGTLQPEGKHQQCWVSGCQGTTDGDHTKSEGVEDFRYIRYYAGAWAVSWDGSEWIKVESTDQVVARYVLKTEVTEEVTTETQDWGYFNKDFVSGDTWVQLDFAVKYEAGTVNPDPSSYPIAGKTLYYHADTSLDANGQKVTQVTDDGGSTTKRRLDTIIGMETSEREVYMITVTQSSKNIHEEWADDKDYRGDERIVWLKSVNEAHDPSLTYDENLFSLGTKASAEDIEKYLPGLNLEHQEKDPTKYDTADVPYVDYVYAYNHQGVLVTYYVRAKKGQAKLHVHYLEWFGSEENSQEFYQYGLITEEDKFNDSFAMDMTQPDLLVGNTVTSDVGFKVTVTGVLTKMPAVPAKYRTGEYSLMKVVRTNTDVFLYYTGTGLERYVVADFGLPLELTWENVFRTLEESKRFNFIGMKYMDENFSDEKYSYAVAPLQYGTITNGTATQDGLYETLTYTPTKVFTGNEETFYVAVTMDVPVTTDGKEKLERTTKYCAIHVLPATTVYYEPVSDFVTVSNNGWTVTNGDLSALRQGTYSVLKDTHNPYGFDSAYEKTTGASANVEMTAVSSNVAAKFEFTGTGVEVYANCTKDTGLLMATLSQKQDDGSFKALRGFIVDTKLGEGTTAGTNFQTWENAYSVPVVALKDLDYGTYKMSLYEISKRGEARSHVRIDGIRVTDPVMEQINRIVYSQVQEMDPKFLEIRDLVLATVTLPEGKDSEYKNDLAKDLNSQVQGNVKSISGFVVSESPVADSVSLDVLDNGPKNEFYLQKDQSLVLAVSKNYEYQVGMKSIDGKLAYGDKTLGTTDLYYKVTKTTTESGTILTITNTGNGVLVLTKLKCLPVNQSYNTSSGTAALSDMISTFTAESMAQAIMALTETDADEEQPTEPDPGQPENPEEPKEPENPKDPKDPQDPNDSIVKKVSDFKDVDETDWFYEPVKLVSESGLMVGVADDRFGPNIPLTRAMMVQILYTVEGSEPNDGKIKFRDVDPGDWYAKAVCWAYAQGIVSGTSDTTFDPNKPITREQMVAILYRYADYIGMQPEAKGSLTAFPDCGSVSAWAEDAMRWAVSAKIIAGSGGKIQPQGTATRAQVATVLKGFADWFVIREGELGY